MSNSKLATYVNLTSNHSGRRTQPITKIAIHHMAGRMTAKQCADYFVRTSRQVSSNYTIGWDGSIALSVEEKNRAWTTSSPWCDQRAITIEVSNADNNGGQWRVTDAAYRALLDLVEDIARRNNIKNVSYTGGKDGVLQKHEWYSNTNCPGPYLGSKFPEISRIVNARLKGHVPAKIDTSKGTYRLNHVASTYLTANDALTGKNARGSYNPGDYYIFREYNGAINITKRPGAAGGWINPKEQGPKINPPKLKSVSQVAQEVISGAWGNGQDRVNKLKAAGYDASIVQAEVDRVLRGKPAPKPKKSVSQLAQEVIDGKWGNGADRKRRLEQAGYSYSAVQKEVDRRFSKPTTKSLSQIAQEVLNGSWGNGSERKRRLEQAGYNYSEVQREVNRRLGQ